MTKKSNIFDPFGDYETAGYLRNTLKSKSAKEIKFQEHLFFRANILEAGNYLKTRENINYKDFREVHKILFEGFYPWAGQDRHTLGVARYVTKADRVTFVASEESERAVSHGLSLGNNTEYIAKRPGEVMGLFAWGHPFLDGNGRAMVVVHTELMARAGLFIDWGQSEKNAYLQALTTELDSPNNRILDKYLNKIAQPLTAHRTLHEKILEIEGLEGVGDDIDTDVSYDENDPVGQRRYQEKLQSRRYTIPIN